MSQQAHQDYSQTDPWASDGINGYSDEPPF
jgi:hypothetical protein